jgi:hypothetical protein
MHNFGFIGLNIQIIFQKNYPHFIIIPNLEAGIELLP